MHLVCQIWGTQLASYSLRYMMRFPHDLSHKEGMLQTMTKNRDATVILVPKDHLELAGEGIEPFQRGLIKT